MNHVRLSKMALWLCLTLLADRCFPRACQADDILVTPQVCIVISSAAPLMVGDDQAGTVPLGSVVMAARTNGNWRYSPDHKGWVHMRDMVLLEQAVPRFTEEIKTKPSARAYVLRGIARMTLEKWPEAAQDFEEAYELGDSSIALHLNLGTCYQRMGELSSAISEYDTILKTYADDVTALNARGNILLQQGQYQAALRDFESAILQQPESADALNSKGVALRMTGRYEEAITAYTQALKVDPGRADALSNRAYARKKLGDLTGALEDYEQAVKLSPEATGIHNDLAWLLATANNPKIRDADRAVKISEEACQQTENQNAEYLDTMAAAYASAGNFPAAIEAARLALVLMKDNPGAKKTEERLALYLNKQPYIETQSDTADEATTETKSGSDSDTKSDAKPASAPEPADQESTKDSKAAAGTDSDKQSESAAQSDQIKE